MGRRTILRQRAKRAERQAAQGEIGQCGISHLSQVRNQWRGRFPL